MFLISLFFLISNTLVLCRSFFFILYLSVFRFCVPYLIVGCPLWRNKVQSSYIFFFHRPPCVTLVTTQGNMADVRRRVREVSESSECEERANESSLNVAECVSSTKQLLYGRSQLPYSCSRP